MVARSFSLFLQISSGCFSYSVQNEVSHSVCLILPYQNSPGISISRWRKSTRFECQSKNIHDKIMMKVNSVFLAGRRYFPLLLVRFPLKCRSNYGNVTAFEGKLNLTRNSISGEWVLFSEGKCVRVFFVYSDANSAPLIRIKDLLNLSSRGTMRQTGATNHPSAALR